MSQNAKLRPYGRAKRSELYLSARRIWAGAALDLERVMAERAPLDGAKRISQTLIANNGLGAAVDGVTLLGEAA